MNVIPSRSAPNLEYSILEYRASTVPCYAVPKTASNRRRYAEDLAAVVRFLLGPDSRFMTGQTLSVDAG